MRFKLRNIIVLAFVAFLFAYIYFIFDVYKVKGQSMDPTFHNGDVLIVQKLLWDKESIDRFDVVVIEKEDELIIKRVIGLPNEEVKVIDGTLYIDGVVDKTFKNFDLQTEDFVYKVPEGIYFVLGDNRKNSMDSRDKEIGFINGDEVIAVVLFSVT